MEYQSHTQLKRVYTSLSLVVHKQRILLNFFLSAIRTDFFQYQYGMINFPLFPLLVQESDWGMTSAINFFSPFIFEEKDIINYI